MAVRSRGQQIVTAGQLRQAIEQRGYAWIVDPRLRDTDVLHKRPRGGQPNREPFEATAIGEDLKAYLRGQNPPSNPFLRARWIEMGILPPEDDASPGGTGPIRDEPAPGGEP